MRRDGYLRHLLVRKGHATGQILVDLVTTEKDSRIPDTDRLLKEYAEGLLALSLTGQLAGILHTVNNREADVVQNDGTEILYGQAYFEEKLLDLKFRITPFSFFQTNSYGAEVLYEKVREYVGDTKGKVVFDLYSGTGTIAQMLASVAESVVGVEIVEEAVEAARENAKLNGLTNCTFLAGDVLQVLGQLPQKPDILVLDPPRSGIHPKVLPQLIQYGVDHIVYVSCNPGSLARDLEVFREAGYRVSRLCPVDQFPWTANIEVVCRLEKKLPIKREQGIGQNGDK
jgi:23S rRNA (uracil-5-)-methyltransferase RumA